jgi:hypothetical protein
MDEIPNELETVAEEVKQGEERTVSVRELLSWFDSQRRGRWVVQRIRKALRQEKRMKKTVSLMSLTFLIQFLG